jgi:putative ABC transport system permease protein
MITKIFTHSIRALSRQRVYVFINILGLAIGIACSLLIAIFIIQETSYDQFHEHKERIYRVVLHGRIGGQDFKGSWTPAPMGPAMVNEFPEVEGFLRLSRWNETVVRFNDKAFTENHFVEADSSFFNFFSVQLIHGDKQTVLNEPFNVVVSETTAKKIFGDEDPIGQMIKVGTETTLYKVSGIMEDIPEYSHFSANIVGSFMSNPRSGSIEWLSNSFATYVMLYAETNPAAVNERFNDLVIKYAGPEIRHFLGVGIEDFLAQGNRYNYFIQPLTSIQLDPSVENIFKPANDPRYLWIFGSIGLLILAIAGINFMNLSTAQATKRAKEVGIKKVSGASKGSLIRQFLIETMIIAILAMLLAMIIAELSLPFINQLLDLQLRLDYSSNWYTLPALLLFTGILGIIAGCYPAFYLSSFNPNAVLKGKTNQSRGTLGIRRALTVLQFAISIVLIVGTLIMNRQIRYMLKKDLGFEKENILVIRRASALQGQINSFKEEIKSLAGVVAASASTSVPGHNNNNSGYTLLGRPDESFILTTNWVDYDFFETYSLMVSSGRLFDPEMPTDRECSIINDKAVKLFMLEDPLQAKFHGNNMIHEEMTTIPIIGTVHDFHYESLRHDIGPYLFQFKHDEIQSGFISVRLTPAAPKTIIQDIENIWASYTSNDPMIYFFLDQDLEGTYIEESRNVALSMMFTILAILIASLGLYGLTAYNVSQRTKEISIRKTFGASVLDIWRMISKEVLLLIMLSTAIAWPLIYWVASRWLENYHFRISLNLFDFLSGLLTAIVIALVTISYRTVRAALINPATTLKYE